MKKNNLTFSTQADLTLVDRVLSSKPSFFRKVRTFELVLGLVGAALLAAPIGLQSLPRRLQKEETRTAKFSILRFLKLIYLLLIFWE